MKYFHLLIIICLFGCSPKEKQPELDYVKMDIFSVQTGKALSIIIDFERNILVFDNYGQMPNYPVEGEPIDFNIFNSELPLDFEYIQLQIEDINMLKKSINSDFLLSIIKNNNLYNKTHQDNFIRFEGLMYQLKIVPNGKKIFSTKNYIILSNKNSDQSILNVLNIIQKNSKSDKNKQYINFISHYLE